MGNLRVEDLRIEAVGQCHDAALREVAKQIFTALWQELGSDILRSDDGEDRAFGADRRARQADLVADKGQQRAVAFREPRGHRLEISGSVAVGRVQKNERIDSL